MARKKDIKKFSTRFAAAEIFGRAVVSLSHAEMRRLTVSGHKEKCPFKPDLAMCHKPGGACSIIALERDGTGGVHTASMPVATCPSRFLEESKVFRWVGETILGRGDPKIVSEVPFLMSGQTKDEAKDEVGRIDNVLVSVESNAISWCALEMQAVYFSGARMEDDFAVMREWKGPGLPFPGKNRHPDYRSSGPKRLMPQLEIKVPTLRRWGRKMAVVVDKAFWNALGEIRRAEHISNADIIWFVVDYEGPERGHYRLVRYDAVLTTLEDAVEGLTGGTPVTLEQFEHAILKKLGRFEAT